QNIGLQVIDQGGTVEQAKEAVKLALQAADETAKNAEAIVIRFQSQFDSTGLVDQAAYAAEQFTQSAMEGANNRDFWEKFWDNTGNKVSDASLAWGEQAGNKIAQGIRTSMDAGLGQGQMLTNFDKSLKPLGDKLAELRKQQMDARKQFGAESYQDEEISKQIKVY